MKIIYRIARLELSTLFYSPIAWLVLIIFTIQTGIKFTDLLEISEGYQQRGTLLNNLTASIFSYSNPYYLFNAVKSNLYLYIPLLTMGLISRELSSGSIKLLLSSPVNFRQIVLGKYLAMVVYSFILCLVLASFMLAGGYVIASFDYSLVLSGILGLFLLICAYSAIGLYISCLTAYQVVAAIGTFAAIALLNFIGGLWQDIPIINEIVYWLSMSGRADQMIAGLISSKGILYFLIVIGLFIVLTIMKLSAGKQARPMVVKIGSYVVLFLVVMGSGYVTSRPTLTAYYDMTTRKSMTLTSESQQVVAQLKEHPLKMTSYVNIFSANAERSGLPKHHNRDYRRFEDYVRFLPHLEMDYVYFYDTITSNPNLYKNNPGLDQQALAKKIAASYNISMEEVLSPSEIKARVDLSVEDNQYVRQITYQGKTSFLRMFEDIPHYPYQEHTSAALKQLVTGPAKVGFTSGHEERSFAKNDKDYRSAITTREANRYSLINEGFDFSTIVLNDEDIPQDLTLLVIADPQNELTELEIKKLSKYIENGGNLLIMGEPDNRSNLKVIMDSLGVAFLPGQLKQESSDFLPDFILGDVPESALLLRDSYRFKNEIQMKIPVSMPGAMGLKYDKNSVFEVTPLIVANEKTINTEDTLMGVENKTQPIPIALALKRKMGNKEQRVVVVGDADFMSNAEYGRYNALTMNRAQFIPNLFRWLSNDQFPVNAEYPRGKDNKITIAAGGISWLRIIFLGVIPGLMVVFSTILLIRRKRN